MGYGSAYEAKSVVSGDFTKDDRNKKCTSVRTLNSLSSAKNQERLRAEYPKLDMSLAEIGSMVAWAKAIESNEPPMNPLDTVAYCNTIDLALPESMPCGVEANSEEHRICRVNAAFQQSDILAE